MLKEDIVKNWNCGAGIWKEDSSSRLQAQLIQAPDSGLKIHHHLRQLHHQHWYIVIIYCYVFISAINSKWKLFLSTQSKEQHHIRRCYSKISKFLLIITNIVIITILDINQSLTHLFALQRSKDISWRTWRGPHPRWLFHLCTILNRSHSWIFPAW